MAAIEQLNDATTIWLVSTQERGLRLDLFLRNKDIEPSRSQIKRYIEEGFVSIDGQKSIRPSKKLKFGQRVQLIIPPPAPLNAVPEDIPLDVVYEDDAVVVINKPQGMVVHPAPGHPRGTLVNGLVYRYSICAGDPMRPGLVHRLDKDTTGLMVVAKTDEALKNLTAQFQVHSVQRRYLALATGSPPDYIEYRTLHGRKIGDRKLFSSKVTRGKEAVSVVETVDRFSGAALIRVTLHTGRTHQVRVHCFDHGFALLGDPMYVPRGLSALLSSIHKMLPGQALHAELLGFDHPQTGHRMIFEASPPEIFCAALQKMKEK